jgi:hypothetical protein
LEGVFSGRIPLSRQWIGRNLKHGIQPKKNGSNKINLSSMGYDVCLKIMQRSIVELPSRDAIRAWTTSILFRSCLDFWYLVCITTMSCQFCITGGKHSQISLSVSGTPVGPKVWPEISSGRSHGIVSLKLTAPQVLGTLFSVWIPYFREVIIWTTLT